MFSFAEIPEDCVCLKEGDVLLTSSSQLAVDWKQRLIMASGYEVCETPVVLAWQTWLVEIAAEVDLMPVALNRVQEGWLWEQVIRDDLAQHTDVARQTEASVRGLAKHARDAYALMQEYCIDAVELHFAGDEADALLRWIDAIHQSLAEGALVGRMLLADIASQVIQNLDSIEKPKLIVLAGFDVLTPMQQALLSALQLAGVDMVRMKNHAKTAAVHVYSCADGQMECEHVALRVRALLQSDPHARIAIATTDAVTDIALLKRTLNGLLMPELSCDPCNTMQAVSMNGDILTDMPMIRQLLHLLSLAGEYSISFDAFSMLLFSPWLKGFEAERFERAGLDARFRRQNRHRMRMKSLLKASDILALPELLSLIELLVGWDKQKKSANNWVKAVHELLKSSGFVQQASDAVEQRGNDEIRQMNAFRDVLISLVAVDAMTDGVSEHRLSWSQFLSLLRKGCREVRLVASAKYANVVVQPLLQTAGQQFDYTLVMGMDEESFPPAARPYPLLPVVMQKKYALPMSCGALVFESSQKLWTAVLQSSLHVEVSFARQRDDKDLLASSFVQGCAEQTGEILKVKRDRLAMEAFDDISDVPLSSNQQVKGGTSIVKNQSACPFRAFATHRLGIVALEETAPGIEPSSKGSLIHLALEYIWQQLQNQDALAALHDDQVIDLVDSAIEYAWREAHVVADSRTREYEQKRMRSVLLEWLGLELQRPAFKVVAIEQEYQLRLPETSDQQFTVKIKADRMDIDASGRKLLIDYKTGAKQSTRKWLVDEADDRIEEPQLPQYALAAGLRADDAVAFARVRSGDMAFEGLCGDEIGIKGIVACDGKRSAPDDWQAVLDDWKTYINALALEFVEGRCDVSPRDANACDYCGFEAVCRIEEMADIQTESKQTGGDA